MVNALWAEGPATAPHPLNSLAHLTLAANDDAASGLPDPYIDCDHGKIFRNLLAGEAVSLRRYANAYIDYFCCLA